MATGAQSSSFHVPFEWGKDFLSLCQQSCQMSHWVSLTLNFVSIPEPSLWPWRQDITVLDPGNSQVMGEGWVPICKTETDACGSAVVRELYGGTWQMFLTRGDFLYLDLFSWI